MDVHENTLVIGMSNRLNYIYDLRKLDEPLQRRDSSLKFMTRAIKLTPTGDGTPYPNNCVLTNSIRIIINRRTNSIRLDKSDTTIPELRLPSPSNRNPIHKSQHCIPRQHVIFPSCSRDVCKWRRRRVDCDMGSRGKETSEILCTGIWGEYR